MIKTILIILGFALIPSYLCAMQDEVEFDSLKRPLSQLKKSHEIGSRLRNQGLNDEEESRSSGCTHNGLFCCYNLFSCWKDIVYMGKELLKWNKSNAKVRERLICSLPSEMLWYISNFLTSVDILKLSGTCKELRQVFNGDYWIAYLSRTPKAYSYLMLNSSLSPILHRKAFFSHLWYSEGRISLAAKLNHPEALMLREYSTYGAYVGKDQYLCPSGFIRHVSGKIDNERTDNLKEAERKKVKVDYERNEVLKKRQEQMVKFVSKGSQGGWGGY
ncbi:MAG: F-box protein [Proteobacteria bacterium]|nr:F-box protein [Pseudomonadota bacterium]